jgi:hypothetical protein
MTLLLRTGFGLACAAVVALEAVALAGWLGWMPPRAAARIASAHTEALQTVTALPAQVMRHLPHLPKVTPQADPEATYYDELRTRIRWVPARLGEAVLQTPDAHSRLLLAKSAAKRARLHEVGLGFKDVYGIITAETSWIPRTGASKDGTPNLGIAQFEPATARALGVRNPDDPVESVHVAALHMKEAALWSRERIAGLKLDPAERAMKLREGISIYYNLSSRGRSVWNGNNTRRLPRETQLHILNARTGALQADLLEVQLRMIEKDDGTQPEAPVITASNGDGRI